MLKRYLRGNDRTAAPQLHVCVDCETLPEPDPERPAETVHRLWFGQALRFTLRGGKRTREEWFRFTDGAALWEWVRAGLDRRKRTWLWCHWAAYDLTAARLWAELEEGRFVPAVRMRPVDHGGPGPRGLREDWGVLVTVDPPTVLDLADQAGRKCTFVDLMNWFPTSLRKIGAALGYEKSPDPGDESTQEYWEERCRRDVEITARAVTKVVAFVRDNDLGNLRYTIASQSLAFFRHRCMNTQLLLHDDKELKTFERSAYYGMPARAYFLGAVVPERQAGIAWMRGVPEGAKVIDAGPVYRLDVNCCYPFIMAGRDYPIGYRRGLESLTIEALADQLAVYEGVADVLIRSETNVYPCLHEKRLRLCRGTFRTTLCGPDLRRALHHGHAVAVYRAELYTRGRPFDRWAEEYFALRRKYHDLGDGLLENAAKSLGNALHGKLAQRSGGWVIDPHRHPRQPWGHWHAIDADSGQLTTYRGIGRTVQRQLPPGEIQESFPLIAAYVTAYAREYVFRLCDVAGWHEALYQDADSLHVTKAGYERLNAAGKVSPTEPGLAKVEEVSDVTLYRGPKCYRMNGSWTMVGISDPDEPDPQGYFSQKSFASLNSTLSGRPGAGPTTKEVKKSLPEPHIDGVLDDYGWLDWPARNL